MEKRTALAVAAGLVLLVAGAMSAFALTLGARTATGGGAGAESDTVVLTEYVDEAGNPIAGPGDIPAPDPELVVVELGTEATETIVVEAGAGVFSFDAAFGAAVGEDDHDDEYEFEGEHEDEEEDEHEAEHEEEDEHEAEHEEEDEHEDEHDDD